jgi:hypothetical protein
MKNISKLLKNNNYRYEKKYVISSLNENNFFFHLNKHPFLFHSAHEDRCVNNIYFDTPTMMNYWDNVSGAANRIKVRIRWYGNTFGVIERPILEIKIKKNSLGTKIFFQLDKLILDTQFNIESIHRQFNKLEIPDEIKKYLLSLRMVLMNNYSRKYFASNDEKYRLTYDSELQFFSISHYLNSYEKIFKPSSRRVFEIKYDEKMNDNASEISNYFPFRMSKSSKYVFGVDKLKL